MLTLRNKRQSSGTDGREKKQREIVMMREREREREREKDREITKRK